jgi:hypothetical protein
MDWLIRGIEPTSEAKETSVDYVTIPKDEYIKILRMGFNKAVEDKKAVELQNERLKNR